MSQEIAQRNVSNSLTVRFAERYHVDPDKVLHTLKATAFRQRNNETISNEQMMSLLLVADQHKLNPFTKELFAYPDKNNGIVPVVSVDGWSRIVNENPAANGFEFRYSDKMAAIPDAKPCPEWIECVIYRKDREQPIVVREYLDEAYRPPFTGEKNGRAYAVNGPWQTHTKRMLRHKAFIQAARLAFGFGGIYDEDEADRILEATRGGDGVHRVTTGSVSELESKLIDSTAAAVEADLIDDTPPDEGT